MFRIWNILNLGLFETFFYIFNNEFSETFPSNLSLIIPNCFSSSGHCPFHFQVGITVSLLAASDGTMWAEQIYPSAAISEQKIVLS